MTEEEKVKAAIKLLSDVSWANVALPLYNPGGDAEKQLYSCGNKTLKEVK